MTDCCGGACSPRYLAALCAATVTSRSIGWTRSPCAKPPVCSASCDPGSCPKTMRDFGRSAAGTLAAIGYGVAAPIDDATGTLLERAANLHRARADAVDGPPPWLVGPPSRIFRLMACYARPGMVRRYLRKVSSRRLRIARPYARFMIEGFPSVARALECRRGRGFGGFGWIATLGPKNASMLAMIAIYAVRFPALRRRFDTFMEDLQPAVAPAVPTCALYAAYLARHPDQRAPLPRHGLDGLMARGELRRTEGAEELVHSLLAASD